MRNKIIKELVLGLIFDENLKRVLLIEKKSPKSQKGKFSAIGGVSRYEENSFDSIRRVVNKKTGMDIPNSKWVQFCKVNTDESIVYCFYTIIPSFTKLVPSKTSHYYIPEPVFQQKTKEEVGDFWVKAYSTESICGDYTYVPHMSNLEWLIPMALTHHKGDPTTFVVNEQKD